MSKLAWQIGEFKALMTLGNRANQTNSEKTPAVPTKIIFGDDPQQYILVFQPAEGTQARNFIIFFLHGGGWNSGNPEMYRFIGQFFAERGYPAVLGGYRLAPRYRFPAQFEDAKTGLQAGLKFLDQAGLAGRSVVLAGHSAGAQLASLVAYSPQAEIDRQAVSGLACISGPLDFSSCTSRGIRRLLAAYLGHPGDTSAADPIQWANGKFPISVLCIHGARDPLVDLQNSRSFVQKINQDSPNRARLVTLPDKYHSDTLDMFLDAQPESQVLMDWIDQLDHPAS